MRMDEVFGQLGHRKSRKRVGRGIGSGHGKTSGRGHKGAGSRSGNSRRLAFEGGQTAIFRRVAKRGQSQPPGALHFQVLDVATLARLFQHGDYVDSAALVEKSLIAHGEQPYKVLANGTLDIALKLKVRAISRAACRLIVANGGTVDVE